MAGKGSDHYKQLLQADPHESYEGEIEATSFDVNFVDSLGVTRHRSLDYWTEVKTTLRKINSKGRPEVLYVNLKGERLEVTPAIARRLDILATSFDDAYGKTYV